jgi:peptidyl-prolyl cis-trans isomerase C
MKSDEQLISDAMQSYLMMAISLKQFGKIVSELQPNEHQMLEKTMGETAKLYRAVLASKEADEIVISPSKITQAMQELQARFNSEQDFHSVLEANHLDKESLAIAIRDELHCDATLLMVSKDCEVISHEQAQRYYFGNLPKFQQPERRRARHILITINGDFVENTPLNARKRLQKIAKEVNPSSFGWYAQRYSECPTAMNLGKLGLAECGQLHNELDQQLFTMQANTISDIIETETGLHLLLCEEILPVHTVSYQLAKDKIVEQHLNLARIKKQKAWIASLIN